MPPKDQAELISNKGWWTRWLREQHVAIVILLVGIPYAIHEVKDFVNKSNFSHETNIKTISETYTTEQEKYRTENRETLNVIQAAAQKREEALNARTDRIVEVLMNKPPVVVKAEKPSIEFPKPSPELKLEIEPTPAEAAPE